MGLAKAMPFGKAEDVAEFLINYIFLQHGASGKIITDRGMCFVAGLNHAVVKKLHIKHKMNSPMILRQT